MSDGHDPQSGPARYANGRFGPGNTGRPKGSKNRAAQRVCRAILDDFGANQEEFLRQLRNYERVEYIRTVLKLLPKEVEISSDTSADWRPEERALAYREAKRLLAIEQDPEIALAGLDALLSGAAPDRPAP